MLEFLFALFCVTALVVSLTSFLSKNHRRDWIGMWKGKKIQITQEYDFLRTISTVMIEGEEVLLKGIGKSHQLVWEDPLQGSISMHLSYIADSNGGTSGCQLVVDGEIIHLVEAPRTKWGRSIPEELPMLKETTKVEGTTITDPRFAAAERLYSAIQAEAKNDEQTNELLEELHKEIIEHILIAERLVQSKADYVALGNDGGDLEVLQKETEERVQILLSALQEVHLAVVQRRFSSGTETLEHVQNVLHKMNADIEVDKKQSLKKKILAKKQRKTQ